jgi:hypothetical protein
MSPLADLFQGADSIGACDRCGKHDRLWFVYGNREVAWCAECRKTLKTDSKEAPHGN